MNFYKSFKASFILVIISTSCATIKFSKQNFENVYAQVNTPENKYFWEQFHKGNLENIDSIIKKLEGQTAKDSFGLIPTAHLGFAHFWALAEWKRIPNVTTKITDHAKLAYDNFSRAYQLNPNDKRILGFLADAKMTYGSISKNSKLQRQGYFKGLKSIRQWPEFNKFTIGVTFAGNNPNSKFFKKALNWQWTTLDDCYTASIDRKNPAIQEFLKKDMTGHNLGKDRACYNSWIAPHNIEGYLLNMGDMIVKTGDFQTARNVYALAKSSPNYETWFFKNILENRIENAERNRIIFNDKNQTGIENVSISQSGSMCMSCHKMTEKDAALYENFDWINYFKKTDIYAINSLKN